MWLSQNLNVHVILNPSQIIFGFLKPGHFIVNFSILHAKQYIHKKHQSYRGTSLHYFSFTDFPAKLKYALQIEHDIAFRSNEIELFKTKFGSLIDIL